MFVTYIIIAFTSTHWSQAPILTKVFVSLLGGRGAVALMAFLAMHEGKCTREKRKRHHHGEEEDEEEKQNQRHDDNDDDDDDDDDDWDPGESDEGETEVAAHLNTALRAEVVYYTSLGIRTSARLHDKLANNVAHSSKIYLPYCDVDQIFADITRDERSHRGLNGDERQQGGSRATAGVSFSEYIVEMISGGDVNATNIDPLREGLLQANSVEPQHERSLPIYSKRPSMISLGEGNFMVEMQSQQGMVQSMSGSGDLEHHTKETSRLHSAPLRQAVQPPMPRKEPPRIFIGRTFLSKI